LTIIERIRLKTRDGDYELTIPHFFEEMADDHLTFDDVENAIAKGRVRKKFTAILAAPDMRSSVPLEMNGR